MLNVHIWLVVCITDLNLFLFAAYEDIHSSKLLRHVYIS